MTSTIRRDFHTDLTRTVYADIQYRRSNYYYYIGKVDSWGTIDLPPDIEDFSSRTENDIRDNIIYLKKISGNDVSMVIDSFNWISGEVYYKWDHTLSMGGTKFWCVTDDNMVFKCLDNYGGVQSTVKPDINSIYPFRTSDGYLWKYMYTIPQFKQKKFTTPNMIPIQKAITDSFYNKGAIDAVIVESMGAGYFDLNYTQIDVVGTTVGSGATGTVIADTMGHIIGVTITSGGSGYTHGVNAAITSSMGSGGVISPTIVGGVVTGATVESGGALYATGDVISFTVGGAIVVPHVSVDGTIVGTTIVSGGAGYSSTVTLTVNVMTVTNTGTGKYGNATALLTGTLFEGKLVGVNILDPGISYPMMNSTSIDVIGTGSGASFTPVVYGGKIIDVIVENSGQGYNNSTTLILTGSGTGGKLSPKITLSDFISDQSIIEQTTVIGAIYAIEVVDGGNNYSSNTTVTITGDGSGATATPIISGGIITNIVLDTFGSGYTYVNVDIADPSRALIVGKVDAIVYGILPPKDGHGFDAVNELNSESPNSNGISLAFNSTIRQLGPLTAINQNYRQYGIIKDPTDFVTGRAITSDSELVTHEVTFNTNVGLVKNELLKFGVTYFRVVEINATKITLQQIGIKYIDPIGTFNAVTDVNRTYTSTSVDKYPTLNKYSGSLIYTSDDVPFSFDSEQGINIKTTLRF